MFLLVIVILPKTLTPALSHRMGEGEPVSVLLQD
jgi:hypothetical protein